MPGSKQGLCGTYGVVCIMHQVHGGHCVVPLWCPCGEQVLAWDSAKNTGKILDYFFSSLLFHDLLNYFGKGLQITWSHCE